MDIKSRENIEMTDELAAMELIQYTQERLPYYNWLFARSSMKGDPGTTRGEG